MCDFNFAIKLMQYKVVVGNIQKHQQKNSCKCMLAPKIDYNEKCTKFVDFSVKCCMCLVRMFLSVTSKLGFFFGTSSFAGMQFRLFLFSWEEKLLPLDKEMFIFAFCRLFNPIIALASYILHFLTDFSVTPGFFLSIRFTIPSAAAVEKCLN